MKGLIGLLFSAGSIYFPSGRLPDIFNVLQYNANRDGRSVSLFLGNGKGALKKLNSIPTENGATSLAIADMNQDGTDDFIVSVCGELCTNNGILILQGQGDRTFQYLSLQEISGVPYNVLSADFNADTLPDIAASDYHRNRILLLLNTGAPGVFQEEILFTGENPIALISADLNQDGLPDLLSSDHKSGGSTVYLRQRSGGFSNALFYQTGKLPYSIAVQDIDGNGIPDLVVAHSTNPGEISIHTGMGDGSFRETQRLKVEDRLIFVGIADFNQDNLLDIIATRDAVDYASVFLNQGTSGFSDQEIRIPSENQIYSLLVTDLNGDELPDLVSVDYQQHVISVSIGKEIGQ